ncbi:MAG: universal stress protein [Solirubrobacterales bacterium]
MAERRPKSQSLERVLGTSALFSTAYGNVSSSIYYALGLVAILALGMTPIVFVIAGLIFFCTAATYIEATTMYPEAGGSSSFARHAFNEFWSFFAAWGQLLNFIITAAISAYFVPKYLGVFWQPLKSSPWDVIGGITVVVILGAINVFGAQESTRINTILSAVDFATQVLLVIVGIALVFNADTLVNNVDFGTFPTVENFLLAIPIGMIAYTGIETISNLAEEAKDYRVTIPAATKRVVFAVFVIYAVLPAVALSAMPVVDGQTELATTYAGDPIVGIVRQMGLGDFTPYAVLYVGLLAGTILTIATNAGLIGVSRLSYSMGTYRQLPRRISALHPRFKTPYVAIILFGGIACLVIVPGQAEFLSRVYAFGAMLSFTIAHVSLVRLRFRRPDTERPWRSPINFNLRGVPIPALALIGGTVTALSFLVVTIRDTPTLIFGLGWMSIGIVVYIVFRRSQELSLTESSKIVKPKPIVEHEVEYDSVLVVFEDGHFSPEAVSTAVKLASRKRRGVHVIVPITVPANAPISAHLPAAEEKANNSIERARLIGGRRVTGHWEKVRAGESGRRIVAEAHEINARAIVFPLKRDVSGSLFSQAVQKVLEERPCRVIMTSEPVTSVVKSTT